MKLEKDYEDFISLLNKHEVKYVIVGAYAVSFYAQPRNTGDIDFFISNDPDNVNKLLNVLYKFGFEELDLSAEDFKGDDNILQLGYEPVRIDILTGITGISFKKAYNNSVEGKLGELPVYFISLEDLIKNKKASGRTKDQSDAEMLEKIKNEEL